MVTSSEAGALRGRIERAGGDAASGYDKTDPGVRVSVEDVANVPPNGAGERRAGAWTADASARILDLVAAIPAGPLGMSADFPGVVETSSSLGVAETTDGRLTLRCLSRSANDAIVPEVTGAIAAAARLAGATYELGSAYPGWRPDLGSPLLATAEAVHERLFEQPPRVSLTHGGLEPAIIGRRKPGLDMLAIGPRIEGPHAPGERLHAGSAERFTRLLAALVDELSR